MEDYQPIACMDHERLEFAVLRQTVLSLHLKDGRRVAGKPLDVYTQSGAEWLRFRDQDGTEETLRLDQIASISER